MAKITKKTNPMLIGLIQELKKQSNENDVQIWKDIAKSGRKFVEENYDINKWNNELITLYKEINKK